MKTPPDHPIFLCGMMGSGKSTVGRTLARRLKTDFLDLDREIERSENRTIPEIFEQDGEPRFREIERSILKRLATRPAIIALGGGALQNRRITDYLKETGTLIFLETSLSVLLNRLVRTSGRPLLDRDPEEAAETLGRLLKERTPLYRRASITVNTDRLPPDRVTEEIINRLSKDER